MLKDFTYYNPTRIHFGRTALEQLPSELANYGGTVLLVYGKGSVKKIGLYDQVVKILHDAGKTVIELPGIKPNPTYVQMMEGARLVRENKVDLILAVGGGSVIDCATGRLSSGPNCHNTNRATIGKIDGMIFITSRREIFPIKSPTIFRNHGPPENGSGSFFSFKEDLNGKR